MIILNKYNILYLVNFPIYNILCINPLSEVMMSLGFKHKK